MYYVAVTLVSGCVHFFSITYSSCFMFSMAVVLIPVISQLSYGNLHKGRLNNGFASAAESMSSSCFLVWHAATPD